MGTSRGVAAVILAGGLGTRLRGVLPDLPKPMANVEGRPFVEWVVRYLAAQGVRDVVISTGYRAEAFESYFSVQASPYFSSCRCVAEPSPMGTAGGFLHAVERSGLKPEAWLVLNGDSLILTDLHPMIAHLANPAILARWMDDASRYGSLEIAGDGTLLRFREKRPGAGWINSGVYLIPTAFLGQFPQSKPLSWEVDVFPQLLTGGQRIGVIKTNGPFIDIGLPSSLAEAGQFIRTNRAHFAED